MWIILNIVETYHHNLSRYSQIQPEAMSKDNLVGFKYVSCWSRNLVRWSNLTHIFQMGGWTNNWGNSFSLGATTAWWLPRWLIIQGVFHFVIIRWSDFKGQASRIDRSDRPAVANENHGISWWMNWWKITLYFSQISDMLIVKKQMNREEHHHLKRAVFEGGYWF